MPTDNEVQQLLTQVGHSHEAGALNSAEIIRVAGRRQRRTRLVLSAAAVAACVAATGGYLATQNAHSTNAGQRAGSSARLGPPCEIGATITIPGKTTETSTAATVLSAPRAGTPTTIIGTLVESRPVTVLSAQLIVAKPGSIVGVGPVAGLPSGAALRPDNELATSQPLDKASSGQSLQVTFIPSAAGVYPVLYQIHYLESVGCDPQRGQIGTVAQVGVIDVS
jgi:hypothetical protein